MASSQRSGRRAPVDDGGRNLLPRLGHQQGDQQRRLRPEDRLLIDEMKAFMDALHEEELRWLDWLAEVRGVAPRAGLRVAAGARKDDVAPEALKAVRGGQNGSEIE